MKQLSLSFLFAMLISLLSIQGASAVDNASDAAELASRLKQITSMQGTFVQESRDSHDTLLQTQKGVFYVRQTGEFAWNIASPYEQKIVSDGHKLKLYDPDLQQLTIKPLDQKAEVIPLLLFSKDSDQITHHYMVNKLDDNRFELVPSSNGGLFQKLTIRFDANKPAMLLIVDSLKQSSKVSFGKVIINQSIDNSIFRLVLPEGTDTIDETKP